MARCRDDCWTRVDYIRYVLAIPCVIGEVGLVVWHFPEVFKFLTHYWQNELMPTWVKWLVFCMWTGYLLRPRKRVPLDD